MTTATEQPWTLDHHLYVLPRIESRPLPPDTDGNHWTERRHTGKATVVCACGYTTGLVDTTDLPDRATLTAAHPSTRDPFTRLDDTA
ncbi:hypothetical protein [Streptomyces sp. NPDC044948]|uniref:hypothetical protein n=1 Tax=Streptomyces sp. NPDC044948 TaxID=3157092 RepID=UPI0033DEFA3F